MGFNFPNAPTLGQKFPSPTIAGQPVWQWDGSAWKALGAPGLGGIYVSDTAPSGAPDNSLWWESDTGNLYIRYNDGDSSQWVIVVPSTALAGIVRFDVSQGLTEPQMAQGRQNVYAAPFDAMSYNGIQYNGSCDISQEKGVSSTTATGYVCDGWNYYAAGTGVCTCGVGAPAGMPSGYINRTSCSVTTAQASMAAGDRFSLNHNVEGYRINRLGWGTTNAQPLTIAFWVRNTPSGVYSLSLRNGNYLNRSYVTTYTQNVTDTWEYKTITIPGDTGGTWYTDNTNALIITFAFACGTTNSTSTLNAWQAGNVQAASTQVNMMASTANGFRITGLVVLPGIEAPSAARSPLIMRPYDQELLTCQRYYQKWIGVMTAGYHNSAGGTLISSYIVSPQLRATPTAGNISFANMTYGNASGLAVNGQSASALQLKMLITAAGWGWANADTTLDVRL